MLWLTKLGDDGRVDCGRCEAPATCVLHNGDTVAASSMVIFFCGRDLRNYLDTHPAMLNDLLERLGAQQLYSLYE